VVERFKEGREEIGEDQHPGRPSTSKTDANIENVGHIVQQNHCLSIRAVAELVNPLAPELFFKFLHTLYLKCE
jgi:hypothetical protein